MGNNDSRTMFRDQIQVLVNENIPHDRFEYWDMLFSISLSTSDIFTMIPDADIATLLQSRRENLMRVVDYSLSIMEEMTSLAEIPQPKLIACSNAVKLLTRLLPFMVDEPEAMWSDQRRAVKAMSTALKLFFTAGYSLPRSATREEKGESGVEHAAIWGNGLVRTQAIEHAPGNMWSNRYELIQLLLAMCSFELYSPIERPTSNIYGIFLVSSANVYRQQMVQSLLSIVASFNPMGYWKLPYSSYFNHEFQEKTIQLGLQLLVMLSLVDTKQSEATAVLENFGVNREGLGQNLVKQDLARIGGGELEVLYTAIKDLLSIVVISQNTYLPGSVKDMGARKNWYCCCGHC